MEKAKVVPLHKDSEWMSEWVVEDYNLLFEYQFGYCTKRSMELETTLFVDNIKKNW